MKYWFICHTSAWEKIGNRLNDCLKHCFEMQGIEVINVNGKKPCDYDSINIADKDIAIVPLFERVKETIRPRASGLQSIEALRLTDRYEFSTLFLVPSESDIPCYFNPEKEMNSWAKDIVKNPKFGDKNKAIFLGELVYSVTDKYTYQYENVIPLSRPNSLAQLAQIIKNLPQDKELTEYRRHYYDTFINYYSPFGSSSDPSDIADSVTLGAFFESELPRELERHGSIAVNDQHKLRPFLDVAEYAHKLLCGNEKQTDSHTVPLELFRAPVPFPLQELTDARKKIERALRVPGAESKKIRLLLIDNKTDKFIGDGTKVFDAITDFKLDSLFYLEMIGGHNTNINEKYEKFKYREFRDGERCRLSTEESRYYENVINNKKEIKTYADLVYERVKLSHFVLLDFFLNDEEKENPYLAFDFIQDIAKIKRAKKDYSTTWFFITSAVYDSVVKYSQSGLLAEYYESAVVSAGDDPTNEKRQIIFLYKLLTFINARLKNFYNLHETIYDRLLKDKDCEHWDKQEKKCKKNGINCLEKEILGVIRRYLNEFDDVKDIFFPDETEIKKWQDIVESLENVIKQFIWLPEADWYMIQHQIDFINNKLGGLQDKKLKKCKFSFKYIIEELKDRSEVY